MTKKRQAVTLEASVPRYAGYIDYLRRTPLRFTLAGEASVRLMVRSELLLPYEEEVELPFGTPVRIEAAGLFSPQFLAENDALRAVPVSVVLTAGGKEILREERTVTALPFDWWEGLEGDAARVAAYVRPRHADAVRVTEAGLRILGEWGAETAGYRGSREGVRKTVAALFSAVKRMEIPKTEQTDLTAPLAAAEEGTLGGCGAFRLAVLFAAALEGAGLHPVLALGAHDVGVGAWLTDSCFLDPVTDDTETVQKYASEEGNELVLIDADDLFAGRTAGYAPSEAHAFRKLREGKFGSVTDVRRCRLEGISPCPCRGEGSELIGAEELTGEPSPRPPQQPLPQAGALSRAELWEAQLLDLSARNPLLAFSDSRALPLGTGEAEELFSALRTGAALYAGGEGASRRELFSALLARGLAPVLLGEEETEERARLLMRKNGEAVEETGSGVVYVTAGMLCYTAGEERRRAPVVLAPATIVRRGKNFEVACGEPFFNAALFEWLRREEGIGWSAPEEDVPARALAALRTEALSRSGWEVTNACFVAALTFRRDLMWKDLHAHLPDYLGNRTVKALFTGKREEEGREPPPEDEADPASVLLPLPADGSQYAAVALAAAGESFVLHGPPGTGKSQTIANIIANALAAGKRVLFVAEKRAALEVVERRLKEVGLGEFCLGLCGDRADRAETVRRIGEALSVKAEDGALGECAREIATLRRELLAPADALRREQPLGERAADGYFDRLGCPDLFRIEPAFFEGLTKERLALCRETVAAAADAARACGGEKSPFCGLETEGGEGERRRVLVTSEVMLEAARHLKAQTGILTDLLRQKRPPLTRARLDGLGALAEELAAGRYRKYFRVPAAPFAAWLNAVKELGARREAYARHFTAPVRADAEAIAAALREGDWRKCRAARAAARRLRRVALHPLGEEDMPRYLSLLISLAAAGRRVKETAFAKRLPRDYLAELNALDRRCEELFEGFDAEGFHAACAEAEGCALPALQGFLRAKENFLCAAEGFDAALPPGEDAAEYCARLAGARIDAIDLLPAWCRYRASLRALKGMGVIPERALGAEDAAECFEKAVCGETLRRALAAGPVGAGERAARFGAACDRFARLSRERVRFLLARRLEDRSLSPEIARFRGLSRDDLRGTGVRALFSELPFLLRAACPCVLANPSAVAQYLPPERDSFDLVLFDEASQLTAAEAVGALARGKQAIVAGDSRQLPPTPFFRGEEAPSVLDDCLALGMAERSLVWHYRSRHESLINFSNGMYYGGRLCTVPSADGAASRVRLVRVDGSYGRGGRRSNRAEAEAVVRETVRRLLDPALCGKSMGIVTFSAAQQEEVERLLYRELGARGLRETACGGAEPLFVKNLENVQGDERDVILFSVCYGPDAQGRVSLNFGPLNRAGGWRRLNVAASRAREEMLVFSSLLPAQIDLNRTSSEGVAGLKAFLEFAEGGVAAQFAPPPAPRGGVARCVAEALGRMGYPCRLGVGASAFRIDVAVADPADRGRFLLAILCDGAGFSLKDRLVLQPRCLERAGWKVTHLSSLDYFRDPGRELARIKALLDSLTGARRPACGKPYRAVRQTSAETAEFVLSGEHDGEIERRLKKIVATEGPISRAFLKKRCLSTFGILRGGEEVSRRLDALVDGCGMRRERAAGAEYFFANERFRLSGEFRAEGKDGVRRSEEDFAVYDVVAFLRAALKERVALYPEELLSLVAGAFPSLGRGERGARFLTACLEYGVETGAFVRAPSDRISLA